MAHERRRTRDAHEGRARIIVRVVSALLCARFMCAPLLAQEEIGISRGAIPPAAQVEQLDGTAADLSQYVGRKPVVIEFWASWCEVCEELLPKMEAAQRRYGDRVEFVVIGVGVNQSRRTMQRHLERHPMPFRFYFDARGSAVRAFQTPATGYIVALDAAGRVVYTGIGTDQNVEAAAAATLR